MKELIALLSEHELIRDNENVLQAVLEREKIMTTGVGEGVAIPHCKSNHSPEFAIVMGIHKEGVDFEALDNKPAKIIFLLTGPEDKPGTHIRLLSRISRIISKAEVRDKILNCNSPTQVYQLLGRRRSKLF